MESRATGRTPSTPSATSGSGSLRLERIDLHVYEDNARAHPLLREGRLPARGPAAPRSLRARAATPTCCSWPCCATSGWRWTDRPAGSSPSRNREPPSRRHPDLPSRIAALRPTRRRARVERLFRRGGGRGQHRSPSRDARLAAAALRLGGCGPRAVHRPRHQPLEPGGLALLAAARAAPDRRRARAAYCPAGRGESRRPVLRPGAPDAGRLAGDASAGRHAITGANAAMYDAHHGVIVFDQHDPLAFDVGPGGRDASTSAASGRTARARRDPGGRQLPADLELRTAGRRLGGPRPRPGAAGPRCSHYPRVDRLRRDAAAYRDGDRRVTTSPTWSRCTATSAWSAHDARWRGRPGAPHAGQGARAAGRRPARHGRARRRPSPMPWRAR